MSAFAATHKKRRRRHEKIAGEEKEQEFIKGFTQGIEATTSCSGLSFRDSDFTLTGAVTGMEPASASSGAVGAAALEANGNSKRRRAEGGTSSGATSFGRAKSRCLESFIFEFSFFGELVLRFPLRIGDVSCNVLNE